MFFTGARRFNRNALENSVSVVGECFSFYLFFAFKRSYGFERSDGHAGRLTREFDDGQTTRNRKSHDHFAYLWVALRLGVAEKIVTATAFVLLFAYTPQILLR